MNTITNENNKFCWSAIIAGALVGMGVSFLLNLFALAIGVTAFIYTDTTQTFAIGGFIALVIIAITSMGSLGWISGYLGAKNKICYNDHIQYNTTSCPAGCIYGFIAWCVALILTIFLSTHMGNYITSQRIAISSPNYITKTQTVSSRPFLTTKSTSHQNISRDEDKTLIQDNAAKTLAMTTFVTFIVFFIGALSATIAGHLGFNTYLKSVKEHA